MNNKHISNVPIELHQPTWIFPKTCIDLQKWSVIACDQYTSDVPYWNKVNQIVSESPSTLHFIYPEVYLETDTTDEAENRIHQIHTAMKSCLASDNVKKIKGGIFAIERTTSHNKIRRGIVCCIDLEAYDFNANSTALIRASESTVTTRIPPRLKVRNKAALESSHILLLMNDPTLSYMNIIFDQLFETTKVTYQTTLMTNAGSIRGIHLPADDKKTVAFIKALNDHEMKKNNQLLFAVGDGNHSLATAKTYWEEIKEKKYDPISKQPLSEKDLTDHPARFAMVEILSLSDPGLDFEPIHQVLFDMDMHDFIKEASNFYGDAFTVKEIQKKLKCLCSR